jgi:hypothetical protein
MLPSRVYACRRSLAEFVKAAWHVVEPGRPLFWGWHLDARADHLEAVYRGDITQLVETCPPGTTKTLFYGVFWPAWVWLDNPGWRWLFFSNSDETATTASLACRRLVESDWYRRTFAVPWALRDDQNNKTWYETTAGGHRISMGINATVTGRKGDAVVVDDANDAEKVESEADRKRVIRKYDNAIWDRVIDLDKGRRAIVGQRTHQDDLQGHLIRQGRYFELQIPEEFDPAGRYTSPIGWTDPRRFKGELLRPKQFPASLARSMRANNLLGYQAKHLQQPRSREGVRFKLAWLQKRWHWEPDREHIRLTDNRGEYRFHVRQVKARFGTADGAASAKTSADPTVISSWVLTERGDLLWIGCRRVWVEIPGQPAILAEEYTRHEMEWCSVEAVAGNVALAQFAGLTGMSIREVNPGSKDKLARATPAIVLAEAGKLWLPDEDWSADTGFPLADVIEELTAFTGDEKVDRHDDIVDTLSYATEERRLRFVDGEAAGRGPVEIPAPAAGSWAQPGTPRPATQQPYRGGGFGYR